MCVCVCASFCWPLAKNFFFWLSVPFRLLSLDVSLVFTVPHNVDPRVVFTSIGSTPKPRILLACHATFFFFELFSVDYFLFSPTAEAQKWVQNLLGVNVSSRLKVLVTPPFSGRSRGAKSLLFLLVCTTFFFFYSLLGLIRLLLVRVNSEEGKKRKRGTLSLWCVTNFLERCKVSIEERKETSLLDSVMEVDTAVEGRRRKKNTLGPF